jgi:hypothetical protein
MILHLFTLLFVGLKLGHVIDWSWWLVLLPSYSVIVLAFVCFLVAEILGACK